MASKIDICNLALTRVDLRPIQSTTQDIKEARVINRIWDTSLDSALRAHPWNFATRREYLALLSDSYPGWTYAYALPLDCLWAREIYNPHGNEKIEFEIIRGSDQTRVILSNQQKAALIYTERVEDTHAYDSLFISALAYYLAAELAQSVKGNLQLQQAMYALYERTVESAKVADSGEGRREPMHSNSFVEARG